jgi:hypothetical protein
LNYVRAEKTRRTRLRLRFVPISPKTLGSLSSVRELASSRPHSARKQDGAPPPTRTEPTLRENIYTIPNLLTVSRILACPLLGWSILKGDFHLATSLLVYAGCTDLVSLFFYPLPHPRLNVPSRPMGISRVDTICDPSWEPSWTQRQIRF